MARTKSTRKLPDELRLVSCGAGAQSPIVTTQVVKMFERLHALRMGCHALANPLDAYGLVDPRIPHHIGLAPSEAQRAVRQMQSDELTRKASGLWRKIAPQRQYPVPDRLARSFARS